MRQPSNWVSAVFTLLCGGLLGLVFTIAHQATVPIGSWTAPLGLALGILAVAALLVGCRLLWESRIPAAGAGIGIVATQLLLSLPSAGGSALVTDGTMSLVWMIVPAPLAAIVIVWPAARRLRPAVSARG